MQFSGGSISCPKNTIDALLIYRKPESSACTNAIQKEKIEVFVSPENLISIIH